jgi:hypothetical protein
MTCADFEKILPDVVEGVRSIDQESHLKSCPSCLDLVADLELIFREARQLEGLYEPSPRVWNSIEATLRQEGIIRAPKPALVPPFRRPWASAWIMAPAVAVILLAVGLFYQRQSHLQTATNSGEVISATLRADDNSPARPRVEGKEDHGLLEAVSFPTPAVRATYEANLKDVNAYIEDAEASARQNPTDEEAQQSLMNAYEQKSMVYEMALDRSQP